MVKPPLSPHLTIYKPQMTSMTSIIGRICGIYTYLFAIVTLWVIIISSYKASNPAMPIDYIRYLFLTSKSFTLALLYILTFITVFCVTFFTAAMIRHILWDHNIALNVKSSNAIGYLIIFCAICAPIYTVLQFAMMR